MENPWNIQSIYELQFFNCPTCDFKDYSKQELVNHAYDFHPNSIPFLVNIKDESLTDVIFPWDAKEIKREPEVEITEINTENIKTEAVKEEFNDINEDCFMQFSEYLNPDDIINAEFFCEKCNKYFPTNIKLQNHIKKAHGETVKCEKCNKVYKSLENYRKHVKYSHEDVRDFECKVCNKKFHQTSVLKGHMSQVHGTKSFQCEECGKSFKLKSYLEYHVRNMHEGQKDFNCDHCEKSYSKRDRLKIIRQLGERGTTFYLFLLRKYIKMIQLPYIVAKNH